LTSLVCSVVAGAESKIIKIYHNYEAHIIIDMAVDQHNNTGNNEELLEHEEVQTEAEKCNIRHMLITETMEMFAKQSFFHVAHIV